ncbi:ALS6 Agglutinin-like protein 6 [Candida maltosa Xu316]
MIFKKVLFLLLLTSTITAKQIHGVFTNFDSLSSTSASNQVPNLPTWFAEISWSLDGEKCFPGDTFSLQLLGVHRFVTTKSSFNLGVDDTVFASCEMISANENSSYSSLECMVTSNIKINTKASGTVKLPLVFTVGGSITPSTINAATYYTVGDNLVTFNDGINNLQLQTFFASSNINSENPISFTRFDSTRKQIFNSVIGPYCAKGYSAGRLGISVTSNNAQFNCSTTSVSITNKLNSWNLPVSIDTFKHDILCTPSSLTISYNNIPVGFRPYISASLVTTGEENIAFKYLVQNICFSESYRDKSFTTTLSQHQDTYDVEVKGTYESYTTRTGYDSTTRVTTLPYQSTDRTITIEVLQPIPTRTITTSYVGVTTSYSTITASIGGTATVIVDNPYHTTTTVTSYWTGGITTTTTRIYPSNSVDTVIVEVPRPNPTRTVTTFWTGLTPTTITQTNRPLNTDTVIVQFPNNPTVTTTIFGTVTTATTTTITTTPLGTDSVIVIEPPNPTVTTTIFGSVTAPTTQTFTEGPLGTDSVIIVEPPNPTYTTTELWHESFALTTTQVNDPQGTDTVIIYEPYVSSETFVSEYGSLITGTHMESSSVEIFEFISMESSNSDSLWLSLAAGSIGVSSPESTASVSASIEDSILGSSWLEITDAWSITVEPTSTKYSSSNDDYLSVVSSVVSSDEPSSLQESSADWSSSSKNVYASETTDDWSTIPTDEIDGDSSDFTTIESATSVDETNDPLLSTLPLESSSAAIGESIYSCDLSSHDYYVSSESVEDYSTITDVSSSDLWSSSATSETEESPEYSSTEEATSSEFSEVSDLVSSSVTTPAWSSDYVEMPRFQLNY